MPRGRVRSSKRRDRRGAKSQGRRKVTKKVAAQDDFSERRKLPKLHRFIGLALGGGKTDKTCLAVIEYFPEQNKIFLSRLFDRIKTEGEISSDFQVHSLITQFEDSVESVSFDVPVTLPHCLRCEMRCPGVEACPEESTQWMWKHFRAKEKAKPKKLFTPYTERCVEQYMERNLEEPFHVQNALGSNLAPLTARAQYIIRRLNYKILEVFPKVSLWRLGLSLQVAKSHLRAHRHWESGQASREALLGKMMDRNLTFIYDQDIKVLTENAHAFDAFLCAMTGLLAFQGHCEPRPKGFPKGEGWVQIPKENLRWPE
jgi:hypothetical protein